MFSTVERKADYASIECVLEAPGLNSVVQGCLVKLAVGSRREKVHSEIR